MTLRERGEKICIGSMPVRGGARLKAHLLRARTAPGGVREIKVGFFQSARYPDGTPVTNVAAWNEHGTKKYTIKPKKKKFLRFMGSKGTFVFTKLVKHPGIKPRPFLRRGARGARRDVNALIANELDPVTGKISKVTGNRIGALVKRRIQKEIRDLRQPPNSPATIKAKGSSNPLIDKGFMRRSVDYEVN